jgi:hypothetical protein
LHTTTAKAIEGEIRAYAKQFLETEYGVEAADKLDKLDFVALDAYDDGGVSEATETTITIAAKRDIEAGKLTSTTKLIVRHELGHILDTSASAFEYEEQLIREKTAWTNAKPKTAAENWYKNLSIRTHIDPLKMHAVGFPRPQTKVSKKQLRQAIKSEITKINKHNLVADKILAKRFALAHLIENPNYYIR